MKRKKIVGIFLMMLLMASTVLLAAGTVNDIKNNKESTGIESAANTAMFIGHFMTPEREPYPFDVIISDGEWRQDFDNVTYVKADVPESFTFTAIYNVESHYNQFEFPIELESDDTLELEVYAVNPNTVVPLKKPYLIGKEVGTTIELQWEYFDENSTLTYTVQKNPPETYAFVTTWIKAATNLSFNQDFHKPSNDKEPKVVIRLVHRFPNGDVLIGWEVPEYRIDGLGRYDKEGRIIAYIPTSGQNSIHPPSSDTAAEQVSIVFTDVEPGHTPIGIRRANHNYARVIDDYNLTLHTLDGQSFEPEYLYPQYAVVPDNHYLFELHNLSEGYVSLNYPLYVADTADCIILDLYPLNKAEMQVNSFFITAENYFANSSYSDLNVTPHDSIVVSVNTEIQTLDYWGCFVLQDEYTVETLMAYDNGKSYELMEEYNYTINHVDNYNIICVRISPQFTRLECTYKSGDNTEPDIEITKPTNALYIFDNEIPIPLSFPVIIGGITINVYAHDNESGMDRVECHIDNKLMATDETAPYVITWDQTAFGKHTIKAMAYDTAGNSASDELDVWIFNWD